MEVVVTVEVMAEVEVEEADSSVCYTKSYHTKSYWYVDVRALNSVPGTKHKW